MKKHLIFYLFIWIFISCNTGDDSITNEEVELLGNWRLIEVLADPGDGSGTFTMVESSKTITFNSDGTLTSNGKLCDISVDANNPTSGMFNISESTFTSTDCNNPEYNYVFEQKGFVLIVEYPCFEPCKAKFVKE